MDSSNKQHNNSFNKIAYVNGVKCDVFVDTGSTVLLIKQSVTTNCKLIMKES